MTTNTPTVAAWADSLWLSYGHGHEKSALLHDTREPTASEMRDAGLPAQTAPLYVSGCLHGTGYRGIYSRAYIVGG